MRASATSPAPTAEAAASSAAGEAAAAFKLAIAEKILAAGSFMRLAELGPVPVAAAVKGNLSAFLRSEPCFEVFESKPTELAVRLRSMALFGSSTVVCHGDAVKEAGEHLTAKQLKTNLNTQQQLPEISQPPPVKQPAVKQAAVKQPAIKQQPVIKQEKGGQVSQGESPIAVESATMHGDDCDYRSFAATCEAQLP